MTTLDRIEEAPGAAEIVSRSDVLVIGGGPSGFSAAIAARRMGASVTLVERYPYLGGLASGGMVLVLDDMHNGSEITVTGSCMEMIERMAKLDLCVYPPESERSSSDALYRKWARWGVFDFRSQMKPPPIVMAAAFDPDGWKRVSNEMITETGVNLRLHSWFSKAIVQDGRVRGVICETKEGRQALMGEAVIDTTGDLDVAAAAGASFSHGGYIVTTVFRLGNVDTEEAERFSYEHPEEFAKLDRAAKRVMGGSWDKWWLKTPLPGIVWCNCPHMAASTESRSRIRPRATSRAAGASTRSSTSCAPICQASRTATSSTSRRNSACARRACSKASTSSPRTTSWTASISATRVARGRDYYTPYRAMLPKEIDGLIVAGRHYSATEAAQKMSREIPPCMSMGRPPASPPRCRRNRGAQLRRIDPTQICKHVRAQGGDPGDARQRTPRFWRKPREPVHLRLRCRSTACASSTSPR